MCKAGALCVGRLLPGGTGVCGWRGVPLPADVGWCIGLGAPGDNGVCGGRTEPVSPPDWCVGRGAPGGSGLWGWPGAASTGRATRLSSRNAAPRTTPARFKGLRAAIDALLSRTLLSIVHWRPRFNDHPLSGRICAIHAAARTSASQVRKFGRRLLVPTSSSSREPTGNFSNTVVREPHALGQKIRRSLSR